MWEVKCRSVHEKFLIQRPSAQLILPELLGQHDFHTGHLIIRGACIICMAKVLIVKKKTIMLINEIRTCLQILCPF